MISNYHTHTALCRHASGSEEEYVEAAISRGLKLLGFSDHTPHHYTPDYISGMRMHESELPDYIAKVREAGEKHKNQIRVLCGLECEYFPEIFGWIVEQKEKYKLDYLILGNHHDTTDDRNVPGGGFYFGGSTEPEHLKKYAEMTVKGMLTGQFLYVAHPDVVLSQYKEFDGHAKDMAREICRAAKAMNMPLEYNLLGCLYWGKGRFKGLGYPCEKFWEVAAQEGVKCILGVDAHAPEHLLNVELFADRARYLEEELGMERLEMLL
ncbi:MAG: PHP domain-containing protein [Ruminococcaceae bacterium]|nr:PHP domain-containing protein [Oscillospiraceae bacterium]